MSGVNKLDNKLRRSLLINWTQVRAAVSYGRRGIVGKGLVEILLWIFFIVVGISVLTFVLINLFG
jgi:hypothetical protein